MKLFNIKIYIQNFYHSFSVKMRLKSYFNFFIYFKYLNQLANLVDKFGLIHVTSKTPHFWMCYTKTGRLNHRTTSYQLLAFFRAVAASDMFRLSVDCAVQCHKAANQPPTNLQTPRRHRMSGVLLRILFSQVWCHLDREKRKTHYGVQNSI